VEVSASDLFHLQPSEFLNDTVIDLYLKKLERVRASASACSHAPHMG
jgi:Ulp1 family protease